MRKWNERTWSGPNWGASDSTDWNRITLRQKDKSDRETSLDEKIKDAYSKYWFDWFASVAGGCCCCFRVWRILVCCVTHWTLTRSLRSMYLNLNFMSIRFFSFLNSGHRAVCSWARSLSRSSVVWWQRQTKKWTIKHENNKLISVISAIFQCRHDVPLHFKWFAANFLQSTLCPLLTSSSCNAECSRCDWTSERVSEREKEKEQKIFHARPSLLPFFSHASGAEQWSTDGT